jgi:hypothetical protein
VWDIVEEPPYEVYDQDALTALLARQDGVISRGQALAHLTEKAVRHRLATGRWRRVHRGVFVSYTGPVTDRQREWIAVLAVPPDDRANQFGRGHPAYLGGLSALIHRGLRGVKSPRMHVLVRCRREITVPPFAVAHHTSDLPEVDCEPGKPIADDTARTLDRGRRAVGEVGPGGSPDHRRQPPAAPRHRTRHSPGARPLRSGGSASADPPDDG